MKTLATMRKVGGSLVVTVPKEIVNEESFDEGEIVEITIERPKKSAFGILKGMRPFGEGDKFKGQLEEDE